MWPREADAMPLRCPEPFRQAYREVARRHPGVILIDGPRVLAARAPHGIVGDLFFHDAQHPNLPRILRARRRCSSPVERTPRFGWPAAIPVPAVDIEGCSRHFRIDAARWEKVASRGAAFFRVTAYIRYDPRFRNERSAAYERSAAAIRAGVAPGDADMPGWPLPPRPAKSHVIPPSSARSHFDTRGARELALPFAKQLPTTYCLLPTAFLLRTAFCGTDGDS